MKMICGNADKCADKRSAPMRCYIHKGEHYGAGDGFGCRFMCKQHTAKKDRPCVSVDSKRGVKVLAKLEAMK
jgi:hypothetical protein